MRKSREPIVYDNRRAEDEKIKKALCGSVQHMEASDDMKRRIDSRISEELLKEEKRMKHFSMKKIVIGVAAACLVVGTVCIAGSGMRYFLGGSSSVYPDYTEFGDIEKAEETAGYEVKAVEEFGNGFRFGSITISDESWMNEDGKELGKQKGINIRYEKDGEEITLFMRGLYQYEIDNPEEIQSKDYDLTIEVGGVRAGFIQFTNKFVPPDYELTEEDKKNMEDSRHFNLAYGSSEVEMNTGFSALWVEDGISYSLYGSDLSITGEEMLEMAREIIENGR